MSTTGKLPTGPVKIEIESQVEPGVRNGAVEVEIRVNGKPLGKGRVPRSTGYALTANDTFDVGRDSYSPVSPEYFDRAPFAFNGEIKQVRVEYLSDK